MPSRSPACWAATGPAKAFGQGAAAGHFADDDLVSVLEHIVVGKPVGMSCTLDEAQSVQSATAARRALGQQPTAAREPTVD
ncbi:hypothetical protein [Kitasatospora sp. NPDC059327]|uniref:hypothetical protein n=1 Tax=Kitasatospora sp. NPDC059327 TaxID=3346803 RepID=UPI0036CDD121